MRKNLFVLIFILLIPAVSFGQTRFSFFGLLKSLIQQSPSSEEAPLIRTILPPPIIRPDVPQEEIETEKVCEDRQRDARNYVLNNCPELLKLGNINIDVRYVCGTIGGPIDAPVNTTGYIPVIGRKKIIRLFIDRINDPNNSRDICLVLAHERTHVAQSLQRRFAFRPKAQACDVFLGEIEAWYSSYIRSNRFNRPDYQADLENACKNYEQSNCSQLNGQYIDFCKNKNL